MPATIKFGQDQRIERRTASARLGQVRPEAMAALRAASEALAGAGIVHWLTYGALLGLVREGGLLDHDNDIDLAIAGRPDPAAVRAALGAAGFLERGINLIGGTVGNHKFQRGPVAFDLFYVDRDGELYRDRCPMDRHSVCSGTHPAMALTPLDCGGFSVPAPADREAYLAHLYGPGWRIPDRNWDWRLSPPNSTIHLHWRSTGFLAWRLLVRRFRRRRAAP